MLLLQSICLSIVKNVQNMYRMFKGCNKLIIKPNWSAT